jgi:DNA-binding response OmpR family regulator
MMTGKHIDAGCQPEKEARFRVLYVGCDSAWLLALKHALSESEFRIVTCSDRMGAALFLRSEIAYQLLLIDLEWRGRQGLKLARLARSLPHRKQMRIVVLADHRETRARKRGVDEWIMKSDVSETVEAIQRLLC